jgi:hypothetical protein
MDKEYSNSGTAVLDSKIVLHCSYSCDVPYSPFLNPSSCQVIFVSSIWFPILEASQQTFFYGVRLSASCPMPSLEDITFDPS